MSSLSGRAARRIDRRLYPSREHYEKVSLLDSERDSDSSLDLPRHDHHSRSHRNRRWRPSRPAFIFYKVFFRLLLVFGTIAAFRLAFLPLGTQSTNGSLAAGLEQCKYIATRPGPPSDFHTREISDRFEHGNRAVLLRNARMWTGSKGGKEVLEGDLLMDKGLIKSVGKGDTRLLATLTKNKEVDEVDVKGLWVTPGVVDGHSHAGLDGGNSVVNDIHPYVRVLDSFDTHDRDHSLIVAGGVTSSLLLPGSAVGIGGQAFVAKFRPTSTNTASSWLLEAPFDYGPGGNMTSKRVPRHWRHMKHALGENPDQVFGIVRMDNIWEIRKAYKIAQEWKKKQDDWCTVAQKGSSLGSWFSKGNKELGDFPEAPFEVESLVDVLNGKVKLNVHSYEVTDFDALIRLSNEFKIEIAGIHHAHEAWLVPDLLKQAHKHPPAVCVFATFSMYKTESYRNSFHAPKILSDAGLEVVMKSDHSGVIARYLMQEAAIAQNFGLEEAKALSAVTTHPAKMLGLNHRIGYLRPGYDADVVVWQSHPLVLGAAPAQVYIDGIPQIDSPVLRTRAESAQKAPPDVDRTTEIAYEKASRGEPDYSPQAVHARAVFTNVQSIILRRGGVPEDLSPSPDHYDVEVNDGEIVCIGRCPASSESTVIDLEGGSISLGLTSFGSSLGLTEIDAGGEEPPAPTDPITSKPPALTRYSVDRAADGITFGGKKLWRAIRSGFTHSITSPLNYGIVAGSSTLVRLGAKHSLDAGIVIEDVGFNIRLSLQSDDGGPTLLYPNILTQLGAVRSLLLGEHGAAEHTQLRKVFDAAAKGEIPLVIAVTHADVMARLITIKTEVEKAKQSSMRMVFFGATEAHLLASEIANADIGVIVAPPRSFPYSYEEARALPGVPLGADTLVSTLWKAGVTVGIGIRQDLPPLQSAVFTTRWDLANIMADTTANLTSMDVLAMASTNIEKLHGLSDEVTKGLEKDFVAYRGGGMMEFGGSRVIAFSAPGGVAVF